VAVFILCPRFSLPLLREGQGMREGENHV